MRSAPMGLPTKAQEGFYHKHERPAPTHTHTPDHGQPRPPYSPAANSTRERRPTSLLYISETAVASLLHRQRAHDSRPEGGRTQRGAGRLRHEQWLARGICRIGKPAKHALQSAAAAVSRTAGTQCSGQAPPAGSAGCIHQRCVLAWLPMCPSKSTSVTNICDRGVVMHVKVHASRTDMWWTESCSVERVSSALSGLYV